MLLHRIHFTYPEFEAWTQPVFKDQLGREFTMFRDFFDDALAQSKIVVPGLSRNWDMESEFSKLLGDIRQSLVFLIPIGIPLLFILVIVIAVLDRRNKSDEDVAS